MTSRQVQTRRTGFTLVEMVFAVFLLGVFMTVIVGLFNVAARAQHNAQLRDSLLHKIDSAMTSLRRDVWAATSITAAGPRVNLPAKAGPVVTWRYSPDGTLSRRVGETGPAQSWGDLPPLAFTAHGPLLTVTLTAAQRNETVTLVSQQMLGDQAAGGSR